MKQVLWCGVLFVMTVIPTAHGQDGGGSAVRTGTIVTTGGEAAGSDISQTLGEIRKTERDCSTKSGAAQVECYKQVAGLQDRAKDGFSRLAAHFDNAAKEFLDLRGSLSGTVEPAQSAAKQVDEFSAVLRRQVDTMKKSAEDARAAGNDPPTEQELFAAWVIADEELAGDLAIADSTRGGFNGPRVQVQILDRNIERMRTKSSVYGLFAASMDNQKAASVLRARNAEVAGKYGVKIDPKQFSGDGSRSLPYDAWDDRMKRRFDEWHKSKPTTPSPDSTGIQKK